MTAASPENDRGLVEPGLLAKIVSRTTPAKCDDIQC